MKSFHVGGAKKFIQISLPEPEARDRASYAVSTSNLEGWISGCVEIRVGGFTANFQADFRVEEFTSLRKALQGLFSFTSSEAEFKTIEGQLDLRFISDTRGGLSIECIARDRPGSSNELRCTFEYDQSYLPSMIADIDGIMRSFPISKH
jgi:hypothetical protein